MEYTDFFADLYGNEQLKATLSADLAADRLSHAYLIEGPQGSGRETLVYGILNALVDSPLARRKLAEGNCPDLYVVEADKGRRFIGIDKIRAMRQVAPIRPNDLEFRIFLIRSAQNLTVQAQNALLKLLEEPPAPTYFFLLCDSASALLSTVRSRAPILRMQTFSPEQLREYLPTRSPEAARMQKADPAGYDALLHLAGGTVGGALRLLSDQKDSEGTKLARQVLDFWGAVADRQMKEVYLSVATLPADRERLSQFLTEARLALRDVAAARCGDTYESLFGYGEEIKFLSRRLNTRRILLLDDLLSSLSRDLAASANLNNIKIALADGCRKAD